METSTITFIVMVAAFAAVGYYIVNKRKNRKDTKDRFHRPGPGGNNQTK